MRIITFSHEEPYLLLNSGDNEFAIENTRNDFKFQVLHLKEKDY